MMQCVIFVKWFFHLFKDALDCFRSMELTNLGNVEKIHYPGSSQDRILVAIYESIKIIN